MNLQSQLLLKKFPRYAYLNYPLRRNLLIAVVLLGIIPGIPGIYLGDLPQGAKQAYAYLYTSITMTSFFTMSGAYQRPVTLALVVLFSARRFKPLPYSTAEVEDAKIKVGIPKDSKVSITNDSRIKSPYTNLYTGAVFIPNDWLRTYHRTESLAALGHEFAHVKTRKRFIIEMLLGVLGIFGFSVALSFFVAPIFVQISEIALALLVLSYLSHRNEFRADRISAKALGPVPLISLFQYLKSQAERDDGSETHPSFTARINRLLRLLEPVN